MWQTYIFSQWPKPAAWLHKNDWTEADFSHLLSVSWTIGQEANDPGRDCLAILEGLGVSQVHWTNSTHLTGKSFSLQHTHTISMYVAP